MCIVQKKVLLSLLVCHLSLFSAQNERSKTSPSSTLDCRRLGMMQVFRGSDFISPDESPVSTKTQSSPALKFSEKHCQDYLVGDEFDSELDEVFRGVRLSGDFEEMSPLTLPQALGEVDASTSSSSLVRQPSDSRNLSLVSQESDTMQVDRVGTAIKSCLPKSVAFDNISELDKPVQRGIKRPQTPGAIKDDTTIYQKAGRRGIKRPQTPGAIEDDGITLCKKAVQGRKLLVRSASVDSQETKTDNDASPRSFTPIVAIEVRKKVCVPLVAIEARRKVKVFVKPAILGRK